MARPKEFKAEIKEMIGPIKEGKNTNWCKYLTRISYNDNPANIDIRNIQFKDDGTYFFGKGISLTDEECDTLVDMLLERGYGNMSNLETSLKKRKSVFGGNIFDEEDSDDNTEYEDDKKFFVYLK